MAEKYGQIFAGKLELRNEDSIIIGWRGTVSTWK